MTEKKFGVLQMLTLLMLFRKSPSLFRFIPPRVKFCSKNVTRIFNRHELVLAHHPAGDLPVAFRGGLIVGLDGPLGI